MEKNIMKDMAEDEERLARGLGWFSIGLGVAGLLMPGRMAKMAGVDDDEHEGIIRFVGMREIACGLGILSRPRPAGWVWARVAGDAMDLALLGAAFTSDKHDRARVCAATAAIAGITALDLNCAQRLSGRSGSSRVVHVEKAITVNRPPEELYNFWHNFESLPRFMNHLKSVKQTGDGHSHWVARGPAGTEVEWDAEITEDRPNECIAWRSLEGSDVDNAGVVRFEKAPGGRGTVVKVQMDYSPPAGVLGAKIAKLFGQAPEKQVQVDLHRFKQFIETGEIPTTRGQPAGRPTSTSIKFDEPVRRGF
jgi:uncharacterized membrane protein